ncbi:hypothetical protein CR513_09622, partial [Mucuna pruriens]
MVDYAIVSFSYLMRVKTTKNQLYQWVEAIATRTNDAKVVMDFLMFGVPKALISDQGSHFFNRAMASLLQKYGVAHRIAIAYHPRQMAKQKFSTGKSRKRYKK